MKHIYSCMILLSCLLTSGNAMSEAGQTQNVTATSKEELSLHGSKVAGVPLLGIPSSIGALVGNMASRQSEWVLDVSTTKGLLDQAISKNAIFSFDGSSYSAAQLSTNTALYNQILERLVYVINEGDTGGVDEIGLSTQIGLNSSANQTNTALSQTGPLCRKLSFYIPCTYSQFQSVNRDCSGLTLEHVIGGCDNISIKWKEIKSQKKSCSLCGETASSADSTKP